MGIESLNPRVFMLAGDGNSQIFYIFTQCKNPELNVYSTFGGSKKHTDTFLLKFVFTFKFGFCWNFS